MQAAQGRATSYRRLIEQPSGDQQASWARRQQAAHTQKVDRRVSLPFACEVDDERRVRDLHIGARGAAPVELLAIALDTICVQGGLALEVRLWWVARARALRRAR